jgi:hypothetical protein
MIYSNPSPRPGRPIGWGFCKKIDRKPGQRLLAMLSKQGLQPNQQITFLLGVRVFNFYGTGHSRFEVVVYSQNYSLSAH